MMMVVIMMVVTIVAGIGGIYQATSVGAVSLSISVARIVSCV